MSAWPVDDEALEEYGWRGKPVTLPRPGHADLAGTLKYGHEDVRNVLERASARETAGRVAAGAVAKALIRTIGIEVRSHVLQVGLGARHAAGVALGLRPRPGRALARAVHRSRRRGGDDRRDRGGQARPRHARRRDRGAGVRGAPRPRLLRRGRARRLDGRIAAAILSIQSAKGVEIGDAIASAVAARLERPRRDLPHGREGLAPRDGPGRWHRGRDDQRRRGGRADDLEAAADADAPAAVGRAGLARAARGARRALGRDRPSGGGGRRRGGAWRGSSPGRRTRSSAATRSATSRPPTPPTSSASPGHDPRPLPQPRADRLHGRGQDERGRGAGRAPRMVVPRRRSRDRAGGRPDDRRDLRGGRRAGVPLARGARRRAPSATSRTRCWRSAAARSSRRSRASGCATAASPSSSTSRRRRRGGASRPRPATARWPARRSGFAELYEAPPPALPRRLRRVRRRRGPPGRGGAPGAARAHRRRWPSCRGSSARGGRRSSPTGRCCACSGRRSIRS